MATYRQWLQGLASGGGGLPAKEANALLQVVGDDFGINKDFLADPYKYTGTEYGQVGGGYGPQGITALNDEYRGKFQSRKPASGGGGGGAYSYGGGGSGGGGGGSASNTADDLAYLDDQESRLRRQLASARDTLSDGVKQIGDSYNKERSSANSSRSRALENYGVQREDTNRGKDTAITNVDTNARTLADSLRRKLGMASGSRSSAYQLAAPQAVARTASKERTGVLGNFAENYRDLDTAEKRATEDFDSLLADLAAQRKERESGLRSGVYGKEQDINQNLAEVARQRALLNGGGYTEARNAMRPYSDAINSRQSAIDNLFEKYRTPYKVKAVKVDTPQLRDYMVEQAAISGGEQGQPQDPTAPYSNYLRPEDDEEIGLV